MVDPSQGRDHRHIETRTDEPMSSEHWSDWHHGWSRPGHWLRPGHWRRRRPPGHGPLRRSKDAKLLGGIAEGLSKRCGVDVTIIRVALVLFGLASGTGVAAYLLAWLFLPVEGESGNIAQKALDDRRGLALALAFGPALVAVLILGAVIGAGWLDSMAWPAFISAAGLVLVWRNAPDDEHAALERVLQPVIQFAVPENRS